MTLFFFFAEACRSNERDFLPSLEGFFEDAIIELDPRSGVGPLPYIPYGTYLQTVVWHATVVGAGPLNERIVKLVYCRCSMLTGSVTEPDSLIPDPGF